MAQYKITVNGKEYQVELGDASASPVTVHVDGKAYNVQWERGKEAVAAMPVPQAVMEAATPEPVAPEPVAAATAIAPSGAGELVEIVAPMPGKILKVGVTAGDTVTVQQMLCTLEAMKMESAIQSTAAGTVVAVNVTPGQAVQYGDVLVVVEKRG